MAQCYWDGVGVEINISEAYKYLDLAAKQGFEPAQMTLLEAKVKGGVGAEQGDVENLFKLGMLYRSGKDGLPKDLSASVRYFTLAADMGHAMSQLMLGMCLMDGEGTAVNLPKAMRYAKMAVDQGVSLEGAVQQCAGSLLGIDLKEAAQYVKEAADKGDSAMQMKMGDMFELGQNVSRNLKEALRYYHLAAAQANNDAYEALGRCYAGGVGTEVNLKAAFRYFELSALKGFADCQLNVACCYLKGFGVQKDREQAKKYLKLAAAQGNKNAADLFRKMDAGQL